MEEKLLHEFKKGNDEAFNLLVQTIRKRLFMVAMSRMQNEADAEDVVQETLVKIYNNINKLKDESKFDSWTMKILINECNRLYKSKDNNCSYEQIDAEYFVSDGNIFNDVEDNLDFFEILNSQSKLDRTILSMYFSKDYTSKQISEILNIKENTIKSRIKRAADKIKDRKKEG